MWIDRLFNNFLEETRAVAEWPLEFPPFHFVSYSHESLLPQRQELNGGTLDVLRSTPVQHYFRHTAKTTCEAESTRLDPLVPPLLEAHPR